MLRPDSRQWAIRRKAAGRRQPCASPPGRCRQSRKYRRSASMRYGVRPSRSGVTCKTDHAGNIGVVRPGYLCPAVTPRLYYPPEISPESLPAPLSGGAPPKIGGARLVQLPIFPPARLKILTFFCLATKAPGSGARLRMRTAAGFPIDKI